MTTPTDENQTTQQSTESEAGNEAEEGWTSNGEDLQDEAEAPAAEGKDEEAGETETKTEEGEKEEKTPEPNFHEANAKKFRDKYSNSKNEAETLRKAVRKLEEEGLVDRDEIAEKIGVKPEFLTSVLDKTELPEAGEEGHVQQLEARFAEDCHNPTVQKALQKMYGDKAAQEEILKAFDFAVANDPELRDKYFNTAPDDVVYFAMDEGKAALEDFREANQAGSPRAVLAENRRLKAENEALKKAAANPKQATTQANEEEDEPEGEKPQTLSARENRLKAMMQ